MPSVLRLLEKLSDPVIPPVAARTLRSVVLSMQSVADGAVLTWSGDANSRPVVVLVFAPAGAVARCDGAECAVGPYNALLLHPDRAVTALITGAQSVLPVWVPWQLVSEIEHDVEALAHVVPRSALLTAIAGFVTSILEGSDASTSHTDYVLEKLISEMLIGVMLDGGSPLRPARQAMPMERARTILALRRADPAFGPEDLARELHMSTRQLQRLFARHGATPRDELRRLRVELAHDLLRDDAYRELSLDLLAGYAGFRNATALRRAFAALGVPVPRRSTGYFSARDPEPPGARHSSKRPPLPDADRP